MLGTSQPGRATDRGAAAWRTRMLSAAQAWAASRWALQLQRRVAQEGHKPPCARSLHAHLWGRATQRHPLTNPYVPGSLSSTQELDLSDNAVGDARGLAGLAAAPLPRLSKLALASTAMTPRGVRALLGAAPCWAPRLARLDIRQTAKAISASTVPPAMPGSHSHPAPFSFLRLEKPVGRCGAHLLPPQASVWRKAKLLVHAQPTSACALGDSFSHNFSQTHGGSCGRRRGIAAVPGMGRPWHGGTLCWMVRRLTGQPRPCGKSRPAPALTSGNNHFHY